MRKLSVWKEEMACSRSELVVELGLEARSLSLVSYSNSPLLCDGSSISV